MKTITCAVPMTVETKRALALHLPAAAGGILSAVLLHQVALDGLWGLTGDRLPLAVAGASAWLYAGLALGAPTLGRALAHAGFGIALFVAAVLALSSPAPTLVPMYAAQAAWILVHGRSIGHPTFIAAWAAFTLTFAIVLGP